MDETRGAHRSTRLRFIAARLARLAVGFFVATICYSAVANAMLETTVHAQINEALLGVMAGCPSSDPAERAAYRADARAAMERSYWLDRPRWMRILARSWNIVTLDLGEARFDYTMAEPHSQLVSAIILERLPSTLILFGLTTALSLPLGLWMGRNMARKPGSLLDRVATLVTMLMFGTPTWWLGTFMILLFVYVVPIFRMGALYTPGLPDNAIVRALDYLSYLALPVLTLVIVKVWGVAYYTRAMTLVPLQEDFVMAARGRGIPERKILTRHGMRVAAPGIVTMAAQSFAMSICGDILVETVMCRPGIGWTLYQALRQNDIPLVCGILSVITIVYVTVFAIMDILYAWLDPRIAYGRGAADG